MHVGLTFDDKLEKMCPLFQQMHGINGERANVNPPMFGAVGLPGHPECYYKENDEGDDDEEWEGDDV